MNNKTKEFLEKLSNLMEEYNAEFEVYTEMAGYNGCDAVLDLETGDYKKGTYEYIEIPLRFIEPKSLKEFIKNEM